MGLDEVVSEVRRRVTPTPEERERLLALAERIKKRVVEVSSNQGVIVEPMLVGSLPKGTWLRGEGDLDVFMLFPRSFSRRDLEEVGLRIAQEVSEGRGVRAYAEHPYIRFYVDGVKVDLVPAIKVDRADARATAVDRTPFHLEYVNSKLDDELRANVRLLKRFMKGIGVYGAEAKTLGFSGYVCELLTIKYGSFTRVLEAASTWMPPTLVVLEGKPSVAFNHHIVVVDPTDPSRNAAAAVSLESYSVFVAASQAFLEHPKLEFFYPPPPQPVDLAAMSYGVGGAHLLLVALSAPHVVEEVLWSELRSSARGLAAQLERYGFNPLSTWFWSDGYEAYFCFEVERVELPKYEKRVGPPVYSVEDSKRFLEKNRVRAQRGPWIEGDRWVVELPRSVTSVADALRRVGEVDLSPHIREKYGSMSVFVDSEALNRIASNPRLAAEFSHFYKRRPAWLS
ncbi:MAG: CCA tRNA nucleotidyltransferase [Thermoprotei archaeon]